MSRLRKFAVPAGTVALAAAMALTAAGSGEIQLVYNPNYANVAMMGAVPGDGQDDTAAFEMAMTGSRTLYVPAGEYIITKPIVLNSANLVGAGADKTVLIADFEDPAQPIIRAGRSSTVRDIQLRFKDGLVTGDEQKGERVGLLTAGRYSLQRGSSIANVKITNVGTGIYSPSEADGQEACSFSVTYDSLTIENFSYRGIDFSARERTGNVYRNLYLSSGDYEADAAFYFSGEESETYLQSLTVENTRAKQPVHLGDARAMAADVICLRNVQVTDPQGAFVAWNDSNGSIERLMIQDSPAPVGGCLVDIRDNVYSTAAFPTLSHLRIGQLRLTGLTGVKEAGDFLFFRRTEEKDPVYVTVEDYDYTPGEGDAAVYEAFPVTEGDQLVFTCKGELTAKGPTDQRPKQRLCPFYTRYEDTTLGRTLIWTGKEWR